MKGGEGIKFGIDKFSGTWVSNDLLRLEIVNVDETSAVVSLYAQGGIPMKRPFFKNAPTVDMPARYDDYYGEFRHVSFVGLHFFLIGFIGLIAI